MENILYFNEYFHILFNIYSNLTKAADAPRYVILSRFIPFRFATWNLVPFRFATRNLIPIRYATWN